MLIFCNGKATYTKRCAGLHNYGKLAPIYGNYKYTNFIEKTNNAIS